MLYQKLSNKAWSKVKGLDNFRNMYLKIYELDPAKFLSFLGLAWQAASKKTKVKLDLLTDIILICYLW